MIGNARMYAATPALEAAWRQLLEHVFADAGLPFDYLEYAAPAPMERLWSRADLGAVLMCGFPIALGMGDVVPIAAPIPDAAWASGAAVYRSDLIVRKDSRFRTLADTFGGRLGWTAEHSHSGFNALRHHLHGHLAPGQANLYGEVVGNLVTPRAVLDAVTEGRIDVGPLDAYWHRLIAGARPDLIEAIRIVASTDLAPMPAFVTSASTRSDHVEALRSAFAGAAARPWFGEVSRDLRLAGFAPVDRDSYATTLAWDAAAKAGGYPFPA